MTRCDVTRGGMAEQVFAPFLKDVGATDIRSFEEGQLKDMQEQYKARMKLQQHRANLEVFYKLIACMF